MSQSLTNTVVHVIFSTKDRLPLLRDTTLRNEMHRMLGGISNSMDCQPVIVGGTEDHVHFLGYQKRTVALADWVKELKRQSAAWVNRHARTMDWFAWQGGYGAFSVSTSLIEKTVEYISTQEEHHRKISFQEEYRKILKLNGVEWNEDYVWA